jgi:Ca2+-binding EF-hand superfamily protein
LAKPKVYSPEELEAMHLQFDAIDTDGNRVLDPDEMAAFARLYGIPPNFVSLAFLLFDRDKRGGLDFDEFTEFMDVARKMDQNPRAFYRRIFDALDSKGTGALTAEQLSQLSSLLGQPMTVAEAQGVIKSMDFTGTGKLIFDDLCHWLGLPRK